MANKVVAEHIQTLSDEFQPHTGKSKKGLRTLPFMYRIHDEPDKEKFKNALGVVRSFGYDFPDKVNSKVINEILHSARTKPEAPLINTILLRSMAKAVYSETNIGHYGLGFEHYAHFTSPIRRYPDLIVHRMLKLYAKGIPSLSYQDKLYESMSELATHCSQQEVLATEAERASIRLTHAAIAKAHVGEKFSGTISGVTQFGVFVVLDELLAEGLIKIRELDSDYYFFEERKHMLIGKRTKKVFRLGGRVKVQISKVNMEKREIDLRFLHEENRPFEKKEDNE
jgi:ribonuclease R